MTQTADTGTGTASGKPPVEMVNLTIDDVEVSVPKGTVVIRAAELIGVQIPRFCDHPLLDPVGACRQCLVEVEGQRKPMASCTTTVTPDMVVRTQYTSEAADKAQHGVMELLLINHPLDRPVCDKGGECPLQNQAMSNGRVETRFEDVKRTFPKPINISSQVLLDRERCVLCARCTRFSNQIAGDPFIELLERGALQQVGIYAKEPFDSYFSGNTVQICPVGALTVAAKGLSVAYGNAGVLVGGRATLEDAYAYAKFARVVLGSNDIDFRARPHSAEEVDFLTARVAGQPMTVTYRDLQAAPVV